MGFQLREQRCEHIIRAELKAGNDAPLEKPPVDEPAGDSHQVHPLQLLHLKSMGAEQMGDPVGRVAAEVAHRLIH